MPVGGKAHRRYRSFAATVTALAAGGLVACQQAGRPAPVTETTPQPQRSKADAVPSGSARPSAAGSGVRPSSARGNATLPRNTPTTKPTGGRPPQRGHGGLPPVITKIKTKDRVVFITIDDGWVKDPRFAAQVRDRHVPITIFLTDAAARTDYGYFRRLRRAGAAIENHTMTHAALRALPPARQRAEICPVQGRYAARYGARPTLLRPPYGAFDKTTRKVAAACGIRAIVNWTAEYKSATRRMYYASGRRLRRGDIILWHFHPRMPSNFDRLLRVVRKQHLRPAPLERYLRPAGR